MKIRTRLAFTTLVSCGAALLVGAIMVAVVARINALEHASGEHLALMKGSAELELVTYAYFSEYPEIPQSQWLRKFDSVSAIFALMEAHAHAEPSELKPIARDLVELKAVFDEMKTPAEPVRGERADSMQERSRLHRIFMLTQGITSGAAAIEERTRRDTTGYLVASRALVLGLVVALVVFLALTTLTFGSSVTVPLRRLQEGIAIVGAGNLSHKVGGGRDDEFGVVTRAFDEMTERLTTVLATRDTLEREVEARKHSEAAMRREQDRAQRYLDTVETVIVALDSEGRITAVNRKGCEVLGWREEELLGQSWFSKCLPQPAGAEDVYPYFLRLMAGELQQEAYFENPIVTQRGQLRWIAWHNALLREENGRIAGILSSGEDITERKRTEAERDLLATAIGQAGEAIIITDADGAIQYVNPAFEQTTGYILGEVVGKNPRLLKSGEQDEEFYRGLWETIGAGRIWRGRVVNRKKDGSLYSEDMTIAPVHDDAGGIVNYVAVKRDVTEHLHSVEEKTRLEDQLRQSQKIEAIGRLAGGVAHDFNNLTAIVLGYGEMLLGKLRPEDPLWKYAEQIVAAGRRSAALTRQLLAFSRKQTLQPVVLDLNDLLRNYEKMLGRLIGEDIDLEFKLAENLGRVMADPGQLEQVVMNLALNARDAMPLGGRLTVETADVELDELYAQGHESVVPGRYVMLTLTDTGCGMDKATIARIFDPFFTTKPTGQGTGLGLATVFGIVKQSGGYIYAYSEPDQGTTFKIYLTRTDAQPEAKKVEATAEAPRGQGEQILLVDDEAPLRELCATVLSGLGYRVGVVGSGHEALALVAEQGFEPDLLVTDVVMPVMGGAELTERLRKNRPGLKVLYMSGYPDDTIARHGVVGPGTLFIPKPFTERALAAKVRESLGMKAAATGPRRRILMIDDDEQYCALMGRFCIKGGHVFAGVDSSAAALEELFKQTFDVLLVDLNIPGTSGEAILRQIRTAGHTTPAIVLTGDVASANMDILRPLGVGRALEKSGRAEQLLQAIEEIVSLNAPHLDPDLS